MRFAFNENMQEVKLKAKYTEPLADDKKTFFNTYLLITPDTSRTYDVWQVVMLVTIMLELVLMPYTVCTSVERQLWNPDGSRTMSFYLELTIDIIHALNIVYIFVTAVRSDIVNKYVIDGWETRWKQIAKAYVSNFYFIVDLLATVPCIATNYDPNWYWFYYFKIVRLYEAYRIFRTIEHFGKKLHGFKNIKK